MVRTHDTEETLGRTRSDGPVEERTTEHAIPTADEVRTIVEGPRRPIRWMKWLGAFVLIVTGAAVIYIVLGDTNEPESTTPELVFTDEWLAAQAEMRTPEPVVIFTDEWLAAQAEMRTR